VLVNGQKQSMNLVTGAIYPYVRQGTFDNDSYPANGIPFSGIVQYPDTFFNTPGVQFGPRIGFAWDVRGDGKTAIRGGFGISYGRPWNVDMIGAVTAGTGPLAAPPNLLTPLILNSTVSNLAGATAIYTPQNVMTASPDFKPPVTYNWSFGVQRDLGKGMIVEVAYVGNVAHRIANSNNLTQTIPTPQALNAFATDVNAIPPLTLWSPSGCATASTVGCPNPKYLDPTSSNNGTGAFYSTNILRSMTGYTGYGGIYMYTFVGESYYDAMQTSLNKRLSRHLQFGVNYTWSKTILYQRYQWTPDYLNKNVAPLTRPHAANFNFGYEVPMVKTFGNGGFAKQVFEGWRINGNGTIFNGQPLTIGCSAVSAPIGYWTGTTTGGIPFRCAMNGNLWLGSGYPSATADPKLQFPFNKDSFALPGPATLGIGNTPPTLTYGPGLFNIDLALSKDFSITEKVKLEVKAESFNALNHFNPGNPNTTLNLNFATGANTNAAFGTITTAQIDARRFILSARVRF
jgi:hypothetical protein